NAPCDDVQQRGFTRSIPANYSNPIAFLEDIGKIADDRFVPVRLMDVLQLEDLPTLSRFADFKLHFSPLRSFRSCFPQCFDCGDPCTRFRSARLGLSSQPFQLLSEQIARPCSFSLSHL